MFSRVLILIGISSGLLGAGEVTFNHDVAPILYRHCAGCHHTGDLAPMSLVSYKDARPWAAAIREAVLTGKMPPWKADPRYGEWANDPRLSPGEIVTLKAWADGEKTEGNPKDLPAAPAFPDGWQIGKPDLVFSIPERKLEPSGPDEYAYVDVPTHFQASARQQEDRPPCSRFRERRHPRIRGEEQSGGGVQQMADRAGREPALDASGGAGHRQRLFGG
jgi:hypothetical protein